MKRILPKKGDIIKITDVSNRDAFYSRRKEYIGQEGVVFDSEMRAWKDGWFSIKVKFSFENIPLRFYEAKYRMIKRCQASSGA